MKLLYDPACPTVGRSVMISLKGGKFHYYASIGALFYIFPYEPSFPSVGWLVCLSQFPFYTSILISKNICLESLLGGLKSEVFASSLTEKEVRGRLKSEIIR